MFTGLKVQQLMKQYYGERQPADHCLQPRGQMSRCDLPGVALLTRGCFWTVLMLLAGQIFPFEELFTWLAYGNGV